MIIQLQIKVFLKKHIEQQNPIKAITSLNNILCIGSGENLFIYNIEDSKKIEYISNLKNIK